MMYPYDVANMDVSNDSIYAKISDYIVKNRFNNHDCLHIQSCFKKGNKCRFKILAPISKIGYIQFGDNNPSGNQ